MARKAVKKGRAKRPAKRSHPERAIKRGFGILNPYGDMWTSDVFNTPALAKDHLEWFWKNNPNAGDLSRFKIVRARQAAYFVGAIDQ